MDNTKAKRVRKTKAQKENETIEKTVYDPSVYECVVEEKIAEPIIDQTTIKTRKNNAWIEHVRAYRVNHPEISYTVAMKEAKQTYKK